MANSLIKFDKGEYYLGLKKIGSRHCVIIVAIFNVKMGKNKETLTAENSGYLW